MNARTLLVLLLASPSVMQVQAVQASTATTTTPHSKSAPAKAATAKWNAVVPFIEDDFGRALALARERKLPVFIEGWAPW